MQLLIISGSCAVSVFLSIMNTQLLWMTQLTDSLWLSLFLSLFIRGDQRDADKVEKLSTFVSSRVELMMKLASAASERMQRTTQFEIAYRLVLQSRKSSGIKHLLNPSPYLLPLHFSSIPPPLLYTTPSSCTCQNHSWFYSG